MYVFAVLSIQVSQTHLWHSHNDDLNQMDKTSGCPDSHWLYCTLTTKSGQGTLSKAYEHLNLRAPKFLHLNKIDISHCIDKIFLWNFKGYL